MCREKDLESARVQAIQHYHHGEKVLAVRTYLRLGHGFSDAALRSSEARILMGIAERSSVDVFEQALKDFSERLDRDSAAA